jgi:hypothetical protein
MSANLIGYFDNLVIVLGVLSIVLLIRGVPWLATGIQIVALVIHENTLLLVFPAFCFAWLLVNSRRQKESAAPYSIVLLLLPLVSALVIVTLQDRFLAKNFVTSFSTYLAQYKFLKADSIVNVPIWIQTSFRDYLYSQAPLFGDRISASQGYGLVLPTTLTLLCFLGNAYQVLGLSFESLVLVSVSFAPQLMHFIAWDTTRIWTYTILCAFLCLWLYSQLFAAHTETPASKYLSLAVIVANALVVTHLLDGESDHFGLVAHILLYLPVIAAGLLLILAEEGIRLRHRLMIQGSEPIKWFSRNPPSDP